MNNHYPFQNKPLPYGYDALEPFIDTKTMQLHHDRHLQTYIDNLNKALKPYPSLHSWSLEQLLQHSVRLSQDIQTSVKNNGGGVFNHIFFFEGMTPNSTQVPVGTLAKAIDQTFGSFDNWMDAMKSEAMGVFGSGYAWMVVDPLGKLRITSTANQNTPLPLRMCPVLNVDVWEHAYYLKHYNKRSDYIEDWFDVINWEKANERYLQCKRDIRY